jgi:NRAMP (natural resistance-associated macrophage protein)-like metal ion transporter
LYFAVIGPGVITACAGNDAGGIATFASVGADYGYKLIWLLIPLTFSLGIVQEMCARMGAVTGKGLSDLVRERFGVRWTAFIMLALLIANGGVTVSEFVGIAAAMELLGVARYVSVPIAAIAIWWLVVKGSYRRVERVFLAMSLVFLAYVVSSFLAHPPWGTVAIELVHPHLDLTPAYWYDHFALHAGLHTVVRR